MENKDRILNLIINRFPEYRDFIYELFNESESFRMLCEDYYDCRVILDKSTKISDKTNSLRKEYQILLKEIEDELLERMTI